jgi:energy-coupling factor transport system permease protein
MIQVPFGFIAGDSVFHRLDPRVKLFGLAIMSIVIFRISVPSGLLYPLSLFFVAGYFSGIPVKRHISSVRPLVPFLVAIALFHFVLTPGHELIGFCLFTVSAEGLAAGILITGRFILLVLFASLFSATTSPTMLALAIESFLRPLPRRLPGITAYDIATMMALSLNLVPLLSRYMGEIKDAQLSRGLGNRFAPAGIMSLIIPFFSGCLRLADDIAAGMESRGYTGGEHTPLYEPACGKTDYTACIILVVLFAGSVFCS